MTEFRKVLFSQMKWELSLDEKEQQYVDALAKEREGLFHGWTEEVDYSKDIPFIKKMALIEECETGKILKVDYNLVKFID